MRQSCSYILLFVMSFYTRFLRTFFYGYSQSETGKGTSHHHQHPTPICLNLKMSHYRSNLSTHQIRISQRIITVTRRIFRTNENQKWEYLTDSALARNSSK